MRKIGDWVFGSFFRTIGRLLVFVLLGIIISNLVDFGSLIDNFSITNLFFEKVDALTLTSEVQKTGDGFFTVSNPQYWVDEPSTYFKTYTSLATTQVDSFDFNSPLNTADSDYVTFNFKLGIPSTTTQSQSSTFENTQCRRFYCSSYDTNNYCARWYCDQWYVADTNDNYSIATNNYDIDKLNFYFRVYYENNGGWNSCSFNESEIVCPTSRKNISSLQMHVLYNTSATSTIKVGVVRGWNKWKNVNVVGAIESQTNAINSQTQQQQQQHNQSMQQQQQQHQDTMNTITNNTINDSEVNESLSYDVPDQSLGPFSGFIALPLTWVQNILASNQVCHELKLPLPFINTTLDLPCMNEFWSKMGVLGTLIQACWLCVVGVRIFNGLFLLVVDIKSPKANADELTKIRSWEL